MQVSIVGAGNVAYHIATAFKAKGISIGHIISKSNSSHELATQINAKSSNSLADIELNDLVILSVPDDQIAIVLSELPSGMKVAYTSGSVNIVDLPPRDHLGVFYPLQTFTKLRPVHMDEVPILLEANQPVFLNELDDLAHILSDQVYHIDSKNRSHLHVAAVWLNNFTNHMIYQSETYCREHNLDHSLLTPLLNETIRKTTDIGSYKAQTGPARRGDYETIRRHLESMNEEQRELYLKITNSILKTYGSKEL